MRVPTRDHYDLAYVGRERWFSYAHQLATICELKPRQVLEIGVGAGIVNRALRAVGIAVRTLDIEASNQPDVAASVLAMPFPAEAFDVAVCCQVLEHLPFAQFEAALRELRRVARRLVLSLPDVDRYAGVEVRVPGLGRRVLAGSLPRWHRPAIPRERLQEMGHHWEIGYRGYELTRVLTMIRETGWGVKRTWRVLDLPWHHYFVLANEGADGRVTQ